MKNKNKFTLIIMLTLLLIMAACSKDSPEETDKTGDTDKGGGELKVTLSAQPPSLDTVVTSSVDTAVVARTMFETLVTSNSNYQPVPMLAESVDTSEDGKVYTFNLRKGIKFHNGEEMKATDVVASMNRWKELSPAARNVLGEAKFTEKDEYTVLLELQEPSSGALYIMASTKQFPAIMPKDIAENAPAEGVTEYIGTGPFKYKEMKQNQYIHLEKFDDYQALNEEADGLAGKKEALAKDLYFHIVKDSSTRLAALQTAQYDIVSDVDFENYGRIKEDPKVDTYLDPYGNLVAIYNKKSKLFSDAKIRQAVNAAIDAEEIMLATFVNEELYELDHGYMNKDQKNWYSEKGIDVYNQADTDKAKQLLEEAGYNGEEVRLIVTKDYSEQYDAAVVLEQQLQKIGMNVKLEMFDWPTLLDRRSDPDAWELLVTGYSTVTTPAQILYLSPDDHGWTDDTKIAGLLTSIDHSTTPEEAQGYWSELQDYAWNEYMPVTNFGTYRLVAAATEKVEGLTLFQGPVLWNTKVAK